MSNWRDKQIQNINGAKETSLLHQEMFLLDFLKNIKDPKIFWKAPKTNLLKIVSKSFKIVNDFEKANTLVLFNKLNNLSVIEMQDTVKDLLSHTNIKNFYIGINRYTFTVKDFDLTLPNDLTESITVILKRCHPDFVRIADFNDISGNTFVFSHPMDLYKLCR